jgi:hypothetical protein
MSLKILMYDCAVIWSICLFARAQHWYFWVPLLFIAVHFYKKRLDIEYQAGVRGDREKICYCGVRDEDRDSGYVPPEGFGPDFINKTQGGE